MSNLDPARSFVPPSTLVLTALLTAFPVHSPAAAGEGTAAPYLLVLGIAQDGGAPQAGTRDHPGWSDPAYKRHATCLALVDPASGRRWLFEATPDFREQLHRLDVAAPVTEKPSSGSSPKERPGLDGIFLTHAHMGHYTGLLHLGHEAMGARGVDVWAMPRMREYLRTNGPWSQLVSYQNITLRPLEAGEAVRLDEGLTVTPFRVPHRQEYSEVVGFRLVGPHRSVLFIPDIDSWEEWDAAGTRIEEQLATVDVAYLDGTFFANGEIPGRDMSGFPHPFLTHTLERLRPLPPGEKAKVRFLHLNHTNPALLPDSEARHIVEAAGFRVAEEGERLDL